jgi:hypothetical protein
MWAGNKDATKGRIRSVLNCLSREDAKMNKSLCKCVLVGALVLTISGGCWAQPAWAVWSCWYWPWHDNYNPNLFDSGEAMYRYDLYTGAYSQWWEYNYHGPPQYPAPWWGHCHAWAAAAVWEPQPEYSKSVGGITFRIRDRKGLMVETYNACADGDSYEFLVDNPTPGTFWKYLRKEIGGINPMHGEKMGFVGELYYGDEVWNYPIYKYSVTLSSSSPYSGTIKIWVASDGKPSYANSTTLYYKTYAYKFKGVRKNSRGDPVSSGTWIGTGPYSRPDAIWRPYYATTWMQYADNTELSEGYLNDILSDE